MSWEENRTPRDSDGAAEGQHGPQDSDHEGALTWGSFAIRAGESELVSVSWGLTGHLIQWPLTGRDMATQAQLPTTGERSPPPTWLLPTIHKNAVIATVWAARSQLCGA